MRLRTILFTMVLAALSDAFAAAEAPGAVTVPSAKGTLHVAIALPEKASPERSGLLTLTEVNRPEIAVPAQRTAAMAPEGTVAEGKSRLAASIPPRSARVSDPAETSDRRSPVPAGRPAVGPVARSGDRATAPGSRQFRIGPASSSPQSAGFRFREIDDKSLELLDGDTPVLVYNHGVITNPKIPAKDARRSRACFIHPVYGLNGEVLTESFAKDHYHHHGIFWSWPHVGIEGKEYDLWVYGNIQQRFVRWICREAGPVAAVLAVENGWFVGDKKVMVERVWLRVYKPADGERSLDVAFTFIPVDKPITLRGAEGKSYGGLNLRYAPRKDTVITVPAGRTKEDLPDTRLAWVDLTAKFAGAPGPSGAAIFVAPKHPDFPPTWLTRHYGILCCGYPGVKGKTFPPGEPIRLDYRVWIHKSAADVADLQRAFDAYGAGKDAELSTQ